MRERASPLSPGDGRQHRPVASSGDGGYVFCSIFVVQRHECWCARERICLRVPAVCFYMRGHAHETRVRACFVLQILCERVRQCLRIPNTRGCASPACKRGHARRRRRPAPHQPALPPDDPHRRRHPSPAQRARPLPAPLVADPAGTTCFPPPPPPPPQRSMLRRSGAGTAKAEP